MKAYYDARAPEYDEWYLGTGGFAERERPGWDDAVRDLERVVAALPPKRTLDVACGTGFLTRHLRGEITALDQSARMLEIARDRAPAATFVESDAIPLPFDDDGLERVFTGHFYGHLDEDERAAFLAEARRVAPELVVVDAALTDGTVPEVVEERMLRDGSRWEVLKRRFTGEGLVAELGSGEVLHESRYFVVVRA